MTSFDSFMEEIRGELMNKINALKKKEKERRKNENLHLITCERDFYKQEAIRLNLICKELHKKNEELLDEQKYLNMDNKNLSSKWRESEKINKHLLVELERNVERIALLESKESKLLNNEDGFLDKAKDRNINEQIIEEMMSDDIEIKNTDHYLSKVNKNEKSVPNLPLMNINNNHNNNHDKMKLNLNNIENNFRSTHNSLYKNKAENNSASIINQKNRKLELEKKKYFKYVSEINQSFVRKNDLEKLFVECVDAVKKDILKRKAISLPIKKFNIKEAMNNAEKFDLESAIKTAANKKNELLLQDKYKLLENFLLSDEIISMIQKGVFMKKMEDSNAFSALGRTNYTSSSSQEKNTGNSTAANFFPSNNNDINSIVQSNSGLVFNNTHNTVFSIGKQTKFGEFNPFNKTNKNYFNKTFNNNKMNRLERTIAFH